VTPRVYLGNLTHIQQAAPDYASKHMVIRGVVSLAAAVAASAFAAVAYDKMVTFPGYEKIFWEQS